MSKRYTDTEKWKKPFIRSLPLEYKVFWFYLLDDCDHAGIWQVDIEVAQIRLGIKLSSEKARGLYGDRVVEFDGGTKWFVPDFIGFQYGSLTEKNKMYNPVISLLQKYDLMGHLSPIYGGKDKEQDKVKDKVKEGGVGETEIFKIEDCLTIAMRDPRWIKANGTTQDEVFLFNQYLEKLALYKFNPDDYKKYFAKLKGKYPELLKPAGKKLSIEDYRKIAQEFDAQKN